MNHEINKLPDTSISSPHYEEAGESFTPDSPVIKADGIDYVGVAPYGREVLSAALLGGYDVAQFSLGEVSELASDFVANLQNVVREQEQVKPPVIEQAATPEPTPIGNLQVMANTNIRSIPSTTGQTLGQTEYGVNYTVTNIDYSGQPVEGSNRIWYEIRFFDTDGNLKTGFVSDTRKLTYTLTSPGPTGTQPAVAPVLETAPLDPLAADPLANRDAPGEQTDEEATPDPSTSEVITIPEGAAYPELFGSLWNETEVMLPGRTSPIVIRQWGDFTESPDYNLYIPTQASEVQLAAYYAGFLQDLPADSDSLAALSIDDGAFTLYKRSVPDREITTLPGTITLESIDLTGPLNIVVVPKLSDLPRGMQSQLVDNGVTTLAMFYDGSNTFYIFPGQVFKDYNTWDGLAPYGVGTVSGAFGRILAQIVDVNNSLGPDDDAKRELFLEMNRTWNRPAHALVKYMNDPRFSALLNSLDQIASTYRPISTQSPIATPTAAE